MEDIGLVAADLAAMPFYVSTTSFTYSIWLNKEIDGIVEPTRMCYDRETKKLVIDMSHGTMFEYQLTVVECRFKKDYTIYMCTFYKE